jgi:hypothetical protein
VIKTVLGIDPGINIGIARYDVEDKKILHQFDKTIKWDIFVIILDGIARMAQERRDEESIVIVVEDFRLFATKAKDQIGSRMDASQVIGAIRYVVGASKGKIELVMQQPSINETAAKWSGRGLDIVKRKGHLPDNISAANHAFFWLTKNGYLRPRVLDA